MAQRHYDAVRHWRWPLALALLAVGAVALWGPAAGNDDDEGVARIAVVEGARSGTTLTIWLADGCLGEGNVGIRSQSDDRVVVFARPHPQMGCADGPGQRGSVVLDQPLGSREIVVLQPPSKESFPVTPAECKVDGGEAADICLETTSGDPQTIN